jgi:uncharacterized RDD family membrane protein YckC
MKCPSCGEPLRGHPERCAACGAVVAPRLEGALAPDPRPVTPSPRDRTEPLRDIPGLRKRERTWRDEVRERVRSRRQKKADAGLPLFEQPAVVGPATAEPPEPVGAEEAAAEPALSAPEPATAPEPLRETDETPEFEATPLTEAELADLPLHPADVPVPPADLAPPAEVAETDGRSRPRTSLFETEPVAAEYEDDTSAEVSLRPPSPASEPLERPARVGERAQAAAVDVGLLVVLAVLVLYFTGRAARVEIVALAPSWQWLLGYGAFLGLFYAGYFTGTTGQTPGKMVTGLRVVDTGGRPPGYLRAVFRAAAGAVGTLLGGLGLLPMAFDPARRALHDRLLNTRVVHR